MATNHADYADLLKCIFKWVCISFVAIIALILFFLSDKEVKYDSTEEKKIEVVTGP
jgi:hypothetical protein